MANILAHMEESALKGMRKAFKVEMEELVGKIKEAYAEHQKYLIEEMVKAFDIEISEEELKEVTGEFKQLDLEAYIASLDDTDKVSEEVKSKVSKPRKAKAKKSESEGESEPEPVRGKCQGKTAKGCACKNNALAGLQFCHVHNKQKQKAESEEDDGEPPAMTPPAKKKPAAKPKAPKKPAKSEHNHKLEEEGDETCERCEEHGDPSKPQEMEVEDDVARQLQEFVASIDDDDEE